MVWGRGSVVNRCGCRLVGFVFGFTRVLNISNISAITINTVSYSLDSAIRKGNIVASRGSISITVFSLTKVDSRVVISGGISIVVNWGCIRVDRGRSIGRWASSGNNSDKGSKSNKGLK